MTKLRPGVYRRRNARYKKPVGVYRRRYNNNNKKPAAGVLKNNPNSLLLPSSLNDIRRFLLEHYVSNEDLR